MKTGSIINIGWREWVSLPDLEIPAIKAKVDTGARTSSLHAFDIKAYQEKGLQKVRFGIHPVQARKDIEIYCTADVIDKRMVKSSSGHQVERYVILTSLKIGSKIWKIELTLHNRDNMKYRMLLGRTALRYHVNIDLRHSYKTGRELAHYYPV